MVKLNTIEKEIASDFKIEIAEMNGEIFYDEYNGMSAVILPNDNMKGFVRVYLAYCSENEKFGRKRARLALQDRVYNDQFILVPYAADYGIIAHFFFNLR